MRPQRNAAENVARRLQGVDAPSASMRPQRNAAENLFPDPVIDLAPAGFNEAAA